MASSLASQLQNIASLDAGRLTSRYGQPSSKSYLFPPKVASAHDLDSVHALGQSGFDELVQLDEGIEEFEDDLFSEAAKRTDRMMLTDEENKALDVTLERCLRRLGKWIGIMAGGKCIEWLVRRFRVHEMNAEAVLQAFLPYHDSPNFARILAILTLPTTSPYAAPFNALAKRSQPAPREYITSAMSSARDPSLHLLTDLAGSVKVAIEEGTVHRALLSFWTATLVDLLERSRSGTRIADGVVKVLVDAFATLLSTPHGGAEVNAAVYPPLVLLSRCIKLADAPYAAVVEALLTPNTGANPSQRLLTLLVILDQRKGWEGGLGDDAAKRLSKIPQLGELLVAAMEKYGFEQALQIIVTALAEEISVSQATLTTLVDYADLPSSVVQVAAKALLSTPDEVRPEARNLLSTLRQRHPLLIDSAILEASSSSEVDPALVEWTSAESAFVDVHSADVTSRVSGVREMYAVAEAAGLTRANAAKLFASGDDKLCSAQTAVAARLRDTDIAVLSALYEQPELLLALLTGVDYVDAVTSAFTTAKPVSEALGLHLDFLANSYIKAYPDAEPKAFEHLLVPNLLATEDRRAFGPEQWQSVIKASRLLDRARGDVPLDPSKDQLVTFNHDLIKSLASAIATSGTIGARVNSLVASVSSPLAGARLLATLTLAQLVSVAGGYQHVVASRSLDALESHLSGKQLREVTEVEQPLSEVLLRAVVTKPSLPKTQQRAYLALLTAAASVSPSPNVNVPWLCDIGGPEANVTQVRRLMHSLYRWANSAALSTGVAKHLLHAVLSQLGEDALVFLASVWTDASDSALRVASLRHATAFVNAYASRAARATDFQLAIPATLIGLQDAAKPVRQAAGALLQAIASSPQSGGADIYAIDNIYGSRSTQVQLLKPSDVSKYLETLLGSLDDMVIDAGRLALIHGTTLDAQTKTGRKDVLHRRDVVEWLMSHVVGWRADGARRVILSSLSRVINVSRLLSALPLLTPLVDASKDEEAWLAMLPASHRNEYLELVFEAFNPRHASAITEAASEVWKFLLALVSAKPAAPVSSGIPAQLRILSLQRMADGLFPALKAQQKVEYATGLIRSLHALSVDERLASKAILAKLSLSGIEIVSALDTLLEPLESTIQRKKVKQDEDDDKIEAAVTDMTVFVESRDWKALSGNAAVVAALMGVLSSILAKRQAIKEGVDYLEQEVLGGILAQLERITDPAEILRARVGIEVIVKVIRASSNPRTSQRALLVASELARLIPDSVLHNVMPIFTFMGTSDLQRDDAFSFGVVEKTVSRIVPVMTASLKDKASTKLELYIEARAFLSIFTDMAGRLPKHRTLPFFVHLVKSLGADDFLAPVVMLLADRNGKGKASAASLELPLGLAQSFQVGLRSQAILEIAREAARLVTSLNDDSDEVETFLALPEANKERSARQAAVLLSLGSGIETQLVGKACPQAAIEETVSTLITLSAETSVVEDADISTQLDAALSGAMKLLSVAGFLDITARILESGSEDDINRALALFAERLCLVKPELRAKSTVPMAKIVRATAARLPKGGASTAHALSALGVVVSTAITGEDNAIASTVPSVVAVAQAGGAESVSPALGLLGALVRRLASRSIPFIQTVLDTALGLIRTSKSAQVVEAAFGTITALVETVPSFISSKQLVSILRAAAERRSTDEDASSALINAVAKRVTTKTLVPVVMDLWKAISANASSEAIEAFYYLLRQTLRNADGKALAAHTKPLFAFFLDVFDLRFMAGDRMAPAALDATETSAINSFIELVTKLSEGTFKPLFGRLYDWAVVSLAKPVDNAHVIARRTVLLRVMDGLLAKFRHLLTPYMATLLPFVDELLAAYRAGEIKDEALWALLLNVLARSLDVDDGAFWTDATLLRITPALIAQLGVFPETTSAPDSPSAKALAAVAAATNSETALKKVNSAICLATRADEPKDRMAALRALDAAWARHSDELIQFVPETVSEFLAELIEDENAEVESLARSVLARIEGVVGSLKEYLE